MKEKEEIYFICKYDPPTIKSKFMFFKNFKYLCVIQYIFKLLDFIIYSLKLINIYHELYAFIKKCQICNKDLKKFIDLNKQPLCDDLLKKPKKNIFYKLKVKFVKIV